MKKWFWPAWAFVAGIVLVILYTPPRVSIPSPSPPPPRVRCVEWRGEMNGVVGFGGGYVVRCVRAETLP